MKKLLCSSIIILLVTSWAIPSAYASSGNSVFIPELMTTTYNESINTVFSALSLDETTIAMIESYARVTYLKQDGNRTVYANDDQSIFFFFGSTGRYATADNLMFYTSLKDNNPVKNLPQHAFSFAVCTLDRTVDFTSFGLWVNDAEDGNTFFSTSFDAHYKLEAANYSSIMLMKK